MFCMMDFFMLVLTLICMILLFEVRASFLEDLSSDFTTLQNSGRIRICNFITCRESDNSKLIRKVSSKFQCFSTVKNQEWHIKDWYVSGHLQLFILDMACIRSPKILREASTLKLFTITHIWLIVNSTPTTANHTLQPLHPDTTMDVLQKSGINIISQVYVANQVSAGYFELTGAFKRDPPAPALTENLGYWTPSHGLVFEGDPSPALRRYNMEGRQFTGSFAITNSDSLNHMDDMVDAHIDNLSKMNSVFSNLIMFGLNATVKYYITKTWGESTNGAYDGMIGHAQRGEAEMLLSPLLMNHERMEFLEYIAVTSYIRIKFIFLSPPLSYKNNIFVLPFSSGVWYCCCALIFSSIIILYVTSTYENDRKLVFEKCKFKIVRPTDSVEEKLEQQEITRLPNTWSEVILMNLGTLCQQDTQVEPKGIPGRMSIYFVKIAVLFLYVSYSANIVVLLQSSDRSITTLDGLDKSSMKLGAHDISYVRYYFKAAGDPVRKALSRKVSPQKDFLPPEEGIAKVQSGLFAYYIERTPGYHMVRKMMDEDEKCRLQELDESFMPDLDPTIALKKFCPYSKILRIMFKRLHEYGHTRREIRRIATSKPTCTENHMSYVTVGIADCRAGFIILAAGMVAAGFVFLTELMYNMRNQFVEGSKVRRTRFRMNHTPNFSMEELKDHFSIRKVW